MGEIKVIDPRGVNDSASCPRAGEGGGHCWAPPNATRVPPGNSLGTLTGGTIHRMASPSTCASIVRQRGTQRQRASGTKVIQLRGASPSCWVLGPRWHPAVATPRSTV